jgi:tripartite-type tricarboxylate transporter receptor subunit TctC
LKTLEWTISLFLTALALGAIATPTMADEVADFYRGKRMTMYIGSSPGDGTDLYGRLIASHMGRYIPGNPQISPSNVPGANGLIAANQLYNTASKDGLSIGTFSRYAAFEALWKNPAARFAPERFNWVGNVNIDVSVCITWHEAGVKTLSDFMSRDLKMGATNESHVNILNNLFGAKLRAIKGYPGGNEVNLALERGEVDGRCNIAWSALLATRPDWVSDKKVDVLIQFAHKRLPELQDVALVTDLVKTEEQKQIINLILAAQLMARLVVAPPDVPAARVSALRKAFDETMKDTGFQSDANRLGAPVEPVGGAEIQQLVEEISRTPSDVIKTFNSIVGGSP